MSRFKYGLRRALLGAAVASGAWLASATSASAFSYANGDLILVFVNKGFEVIVNEGQTPTGPTGVSFDPSQLTGILPSTWSGTLVGADWTALSVRNPDLTTNNTSAGPVSALNLILSTTQNVNQVGYLDIGNAQPVLSPAGGGTGWFQMLKQIGAANGGDILRNTANQLVISSALSTGQSYLNNVGFGTDTVGNTLPITTSAIFGLGAGQTESMPLYELIQNLTEDPFGSGNFDFGVTLNSLGQIQAIPEPGTVLLLGAGLLGLVRFGSRRVS